MMDQIKEGMFALREAGKLEFPLNHLANIPATLTPLVLDAIRDTVTAATEAMAWLRGVALEGAKEKMPVRWVSPIGFLVLQGYMKQESVQIKTHQGGVRIDVAIRKERDQIDPQKQAAGIAPNFVHSCGAAHLMATVNACAVSGMRAFAMIHDSYGTHAGNDGVLARALHKEFVRLYLQDMLADLRQQLMSAAGREAGGRPLSAAGARGVGSPRGCVLRLLLFLTAVTPRPYVSEGGGIQDTWSSGTAPPECPFSLPPPGAVMR